MNNFFNFPQEVQDKILLLTNLNIAIIFNNLYVIKKLLLFKDWDDILLNYSGNTIKYLYYKKWNINNLNIHAAPDFTNSYIDNGIIYNDILKVKMIDKIFKKSSMVSISSRDYAEKNKFIKILSWIKINKPVSFIGYLIGGKDIINTHTRFNYVLNNTLKEI